MYVHNYRKPWCFCSLFQSCSSPVRLLYDHGPGMTTHTPEEGCQKKCVVKRHTHLHAHPPNTKKYKFTKIQIYQYTNLQYTKIQIYKYTETQTLHLGSFMACRKLLNCFAGGGGAPPRPGEPDRGFRPTQQRSAKAWCEITSWRRKWLCTPAHYMYS